MWAFVSKANVQMEDLIHDVNNADSLFTDVLSYYGEEDKNISSSEFYGIFKTFITSYKVSTDHPPTICDSLSSRNAKRRIRPPLRKK